MSSKKCISLESFNPDDLVFGETKEGEMSDGTSFKKIPISIQHVCIFVARTTTLQMRAKTIVFSELKSKPRETESFLDEI